MCIVLVTTAHPSYSLIILDNRDEFIRRPTSRPHWWSARHQEILSSRDLLRKEQGTWLGITKTGNFAVLTNYKESDDPEHPLQGLKSRGGMVTAWLTSPNDKSTHQFVDHLLEGEGVKGVGGFSLVCGKLRRRKDAEQEIEPLAIISNRSLTHEEVPWIAEKRGEVYGLSNTSYDDPKIWPKVQMGKDKLLDVAEDAAAADLSEEELVEKLYGILDSDTLPELEGDDFQSHLVNLKHSIFIPSIGQETPLAELPKSEQIATATTSSIDSSLKTVEDTPAPDAFNFMTGVYGTQRQTVILVDWEGNVTYRERSLYDANGQPIQRGKGDMKFEFKIEGWNGESKGNEVRSLAVL